MAAPQVTVTPSAVSLQPGGSEDVVVAATDPDSVSGPGGGEVTDSQGNATPFSVIVTIEDPLVFGPFDVGGLAVTVQQIAVGPNEATYRLTAAP